MRFRLLRVMAVAPLTAFLTLAPGIIIGQPSRHAQTVQIAASVPDATTPTTLSRRERNRLVAQVNDTIARNTLSLAILHRAVDQATWDATVLRNDKAREEAAKMKVSADQGAVTRPPAAAPSMPDSECAGLVEKYFGDVLDWAMRVVNRESGCNPGVINWREGCDSSGRTDSHAYGVFQLCWPMHQATFDAVGCSQPLDAECNIRAARRLYDEQGPAPWGG